MCYNILTEAQTVAYSGGGGGVEGQTTKGYSHEIEPSNKYIAKQ